MNGSLPKPANKINAPPPSGETFPVLHFSDWHMNPRFDVGSEANCTSGLCCRIDAINSGLFPNTTQKSLPASRSGDYLCDTPADLGLSAFADMRSRIDLSTVPFAIFTGDIVSHDRTDQPSRALTEYEERTAYETFQAQLGGNLAVYATLGNHDSWPSGFNSPKGFAGNSSGDHAFSWKYNPLSSMGRQYGWPDQAEAQYASSHYGAYAHTTKEGLRIISINIDFWYTPNLFNYYNYTNPDKSEILRFHTNELLSAEAVDQRVWIIGHVPIVARLSPATIAGIFSGHTHKDEEELYYDFKPRNSSMSVKRNYTADIDYDSPVVVAFIGPLIVSLTNYNAGWSLYHIDSTSFSVINAEVHFANISSSHSWNSEPVWEFEYDARQVYDSDGAWPATAPLNATFWDKVPNAMMTSDSLIEQYLHLSTK